MLRKQKELLNTVKFRDFKKVGEINCLIKNLYFSNLGLLENDIFKNYLEAQVNTSIFMKNIITAFFKAQKFDLIIITSLYTLIYFLLTHFYPFPAEIADSNGYVVSAIQDRYIGYRPMGYSNFLILIHSISDSINFLVFSQFFICYLSTLFFVLSVKYLFKPANKLMIIIFYLLSIISPSVLYLTNTILSDSLFSSLTVIWASFSLWFLFSKKTLHQVIFLVLQLICLYMIAKIRYTGLFYFGIQTLVIIYVLIKTNKLITLTSIVILFFIGRKIYTDQVDDTYKISKVKAFSGFSGWQLANNALHVIPHIDLDLKDFKNPETRDMAKFIKENDSLIKIDTYASTAKFMWLKDLPLKQYFTKQRAIKRNSYIKTWTYLGKETYSDFGMTIIKNYPFQYFKHFMLPTLWGILYPTKDQLYPYYNTQLIKKETLDQWFKYDPEKMNGETTILNELAPYSTYRLGVWIFVIVAMVLSIVFKFWKKMAIKDYMMYFFLVFFILSYILFHMYSAPFMPRFIVPIHLIQISIIYIVANHFFNKRLALKNKE